MDSEFFIGLISGTSMDGVDAALVEFKQTSPTADHVELIHALCYPIDPSLVKSLQGLVETGQISLGELGQMDARLGDTFAQATLALLEQAGVSADRVKAIGSHGQTIWHDTNTADKNLTNSLQIADPNRIAQKTGITTVADIRRRDIAAGGQGAPLVPAFHAQFFSDEEEDRIALNIGGIANITLLASQPDSPTLGFDTGPGNCLLDRWIERQLGKKQDENGSWAKAGIVKQELLECLLTDPYFSQPPPKSTGTEYFSFNWLEGKLAGFENLRPEDVQCTLVELTAKTIRDSCIALMPEAKTVYVCGGGAHNSYLMERLSVLFGKTRVSTTLYLGIDPDWVEAMAFAWIARETLAGRAGNCPSVTGANQPVVLGGIYPAFSSK